MLMAVFSRPSAALAMKANVFSFLFILFSLNLNAAPQLAFPEADGFGRFTIGGRGGEVYVVSSLQDEPNKPQAGTLRHAVLQKGPRTITFNTSGIIHLKAPLAIKEDFITIAGQSSPAGIVIRGGPLQIKANQVIIRYLRFRLGAIEDDEDALSATNQRDIIIDHCSISWSVDETASFYGNINFTLQHSIIAQSLNKAGHKKGEHGYGGIWGGAGASFHHNLIANHKSRNPRINGWRLSSPYAQRYELTDLSNNVVYNWQNNSAYGSENGPLNMVNNTYIMGPASIPKRIFQLYPGKTSSPRGAIYASNNALIDANGHSIAPSIVVKGKQPLDKFLLDKPITGLLNPFFPSDKQYRFTISQKHSFDRIVNQGEVGANRVATGKFLDSVDKGILKDTKNQSAHYGINGIIDNELEVIQSWQVYAEEFSGSASAAEDADFDGMPDSWESEHSLQHPNAHDLSERYTNLEVYLNQLGAF
jgi:hypothetical protein